MERQLRMLAQMRDLFVEKRDYLEKFLKNVGVHDFYRKIFPVGSFERAGCYEDRKGNGIALSIPVIENEDGIVLGVKPKGRVRRYTITDDLLVLEKFREVGFTILSPVSYFGNERSGRNARFLYAFAFDLDGVGMPQLRDVLHQMERGIIPRATFLVNSGTGLHLYYVLTEPEPLYPQNQRYLKELKYALTRQIWNRYTSTIKEPQMQGILQGFRVVGSASKLGRAYPVTAYRCGEATSLLSLLPYIPKSNGERQRIEDLRKKSSLSLDEAKEKYPDWYERRVQRKERRGRWVVKRDLYDWWLRRITDEIRVGHRFYGIMMLAIYAKKCEIPEEELREDAFSLLEPFDDMSEDALNRFTAEDIISALEMYNEDYVTFPREDIARLSGLPIPPNKRNGRTQALHIQYMNINRRFRAEIGECKNGGRPSAQQKVCEWRQQNPEGRKGQCKDETGLSYPTIRKWWNSLEGVVMRGKDDKGNG